MASQIKCNPTVCSTACSGKQQRSIIFPHYWTFMTPVTSGFPSQRISDADGGSMLWRHNMHNAQKKIELEFFIFCYLVRRWLQSSACTVTSKHMVQLLFGSIIPGFNSLAPGKRRCNLTLVIFISCAFPVKLPPSECHKISPMISQ